MSNADIPTGTEKNTGEERFEKYRNYVYAVIYRITGNAEDTEELVNDVRYKAWNALGALEDSELKKTLAVIARRLAVNRCEKNNAAKRGGGTYTEALSDWENVLSDEGELGIDERLALRDVIERFMRSLGEFDREVFALRYWHLFGTDKIGQMIGASEKNVSSSLRKTRNALRKTLEKEGFEV